MYTGARPSPNGCWGMANEGDALNRDVRDTLRKVRVTVICAHVVRRQPAGDGGSRFPALRVDFVTSEMDEIVFENSGRRLARGGGDAPRHLLQKPIDDIECFVRRDVERLSACRARADFGVAGAPRFRVARNIELDEDPDAARAGVFDNIAHVALQVALLVRPRPSPQLWWTASVRT